MVAPFFHSSDYQAIKPEILLAMFGLAILLFDFLLEKRDKYMNAVTALAGLALAVLSWGCIGSCWMDKRTTASAGPSGSTLSRFLPSSSSLSPRRSWCCSP